MKKRKAKIFPELFSLENLPEKKEKVEDLEKTDNPNSILSLISKCEKLVTEIKNTGADDALEEVLSILSKLKTILLTLFKKRQRKLLDMHWEQIRKDNEGFSKKMVEQRAASKKTNEK